MDGSGAVAVLGIGISSFLLISIFVVVAIVILTRSPDGGSGGEGTVGSGQAIPVAGYPYKKGTSPWYSHDGGDSAISEEDNSLRVTLKKNMTGGSSGGGFKANPHKIFPVEGVEFGYRVYFPDDFEWKKGGKLPGVCWGISSSDCATGGNWSTKAGSFRVMWRESGEAIGYAYLALIGSGPKAGNKAMEDQGSGFQKAVRLNVSNKSGLDVWFGREKKLQLKKGWNTVLMRVVLNSPGNTDGELTLTINGTTNKVTDAILRDSSSVKLNSANIVSFRGGNGREWEGGRDTYIKLKDFTIRKIS